MTERNTIQKMKILEHLRSVKTHPTAEMIYESVREELPTISLGTVYRNLNILAEQKRILKIDINNEFHFDGDLCSHQHAVCKTCGKILDIFQREISGYAMKKFSSNEFEPSCVNVIFEGTCKNCLK